MTIELATVVAIAAFSSLAQSISGIGFALLGVPLLAMVTDPITAVTTVTMLSAVFTAAATTASRRQVQWHTTKAVVTTSLVGLPLGLVLVRLVNLRALAVLIGLVVIAFVVAGKRLRLRGRAGTALAGITSGALLTSTGMSGPPVALALQGRGLDQVTYRATLQAIFCAQDLLAITGFLIAGALTGRAFLFTLVGGPAIYLGWKLGQIALRRVDEALFRRTVVVLLLASGALSALTGILP